MEQEIVVKSIKGLERPIEISCDDFYLRISIAEAKQMVKDIKNAIKEAE